MPTRGVFCLEGDWWGDLNQTSTVKPILKLISQGGNHPIPYVHRNVATREELIYYLRLWSLRKFDRFPVLYFGFHGSPGAIHLADAGRSAPAVTLDDLEEHLADRCKNRIIHFAACETVKVDARRLRRFLRATNASALTGYTREVDWLQSAAFDVLLLDAMQHFSFTLSGVRAIRRRVREVAGAMARERGFRMIWREN